MKRHLWMTGLFLALNAVTLQAQTDPVYTGTFGGGFAVTGGNSDTQNFNLAFTLTRDPKTRNVMKAAANYLRGRQNDVLSLDRTAVMLRDEFTVSPRVFVFGQNDYLRDRFKQITFLWAPVGGAGFKVINDETTKLELSAGLGGVFEKNPGRKTTNNGSWTAGHSLTHKLSSTATYVGSMNTIWKMNDFDDSLTNISMGLTTSVARRLELKFEFVDSYKNKPANRSVKRNDTAFVTTFLVKFSGN